MPQTRALGLTIHAEALVSPLSMGTGPPHALDALLSTAHLGGHSTVPGW